MRAPGRHEHYRKTIFSVDLAHPQSIHFNSARPREDQSMRPCREMVLACSHRGRRLEAHGGCAEAQRCSHSSLRCRRQQALGGVQAANAAREILASEDPLPMGLEPLFGGGIAQAIAERFSHAAFRGFFRISRRRCSRSRHKKRTAFTSATSSRSKEIASGSLAVTYPFRIRTSK